MTVATVDIPRLQVPSKMKRCFTTKARIIVLVGGRSSVIS